MDMALSWVRAPGQLLRAGTVANVVRVDGDH